MNSKALSLTKLPALAAYGTHLDAIHDSKGIEKATYSINDIIYPMWDVLKTERIALCAPGLFISAKDAAELCGQQEVDINFLQDHPHYSAASYLRVIGDIATNEIPGSRGNLWDW